MHENLSSKFEVEGSSDRSFGTVFAVVFAVIGLLPLWGGGAIRPWALAVAVAFLAVTLVRPGLLRPLNRLWFRFGLLLSMIVSPVVMGLIFVTTVIPTGLLLRLAGKDPLRLRRDPEAESYWIERRPPGPEPDTLRKQF